MYTLIRCAVALLLASAIVLVPLHASSRVNVWLLSLAPGLWIAAGVNALGVPMWDWRGDFTDRGEVFIVLASIAFWAAAFLWVVIVRARRRKPVV